MTRHVLILGALVCIIAIAGIVLASRRKPRHVSETTPGGPYTVIMTSDELACEHPKRARESIRWDAIKEIRLVTTSEGPFLPDEWYVFMGDSGGCSIPSEARGFEDLMKEFETRFPGMDYEAIIKAGTSDAQKSIWKR